MNKHLSSAELKLMEAPAPVLPVMSMKKRRERAVEVLSTFELLTILQGYEGMSVSRRPTVTCGVFEKLAGDPKLKEAGLKGSTVKEIRDFLDLDDDQIHTFFCYCHYHMDTAVEGRAVATVMRRYL